MHHDLAQAFSLPEGCFSIVIASYAGLVPAVMQTLQEERRKILYVSGNYPPVLTAIDRQNSRFSVRRALTAYQYLTILAEAYESCIIIEHDHSVYTDAPEVAEAFGRLCRERAEGAAVLLIARRWDPFIEAMAPAAHSVVQIQEHKKNSAPVCNRQTWPAAVHEQKKRAKTKTAKTNKTTNPDTGRQSAQRNLWDGDWQ